MDQSRLVILLADMSGYTRFMVENRTAALHGQIVISRLIESLIKQVDIPLTLQEIEGDAVFLYARHPGTDAGWSDVMQQVSAKLDKFFAAFVASSAVAIESTPCGCAICRNSDRLGLKIIVHVGEAMFHQIAGRAQVSGADVILAHRLLKNSVEGLFYLLLSDAAHAEMQPHLRGEFEVREEACDGFDRVRVHVRPLEAELLAARDNLYKLPEEQLRAAVGKYTAAATPRRGWQLVKEQWRRPVRGYGWIEKALMGWDAVVLWPAAFLLYYRRAIPERVLARGKRRDDLRTRGRAGG